ncbi:MAG: hypothetical protein FP816_19585 [Desulfobacteraceae bacterium]|nr:hypothetical protein [Desulfobacteraceae bacterium]
MSNLPAIRNDSINQALSSIKELSPEAYGVLAAVVSQNVVVLGEDEAFTLRDKDGEIRAFRKKLTLSAKNGGLIKPTHDGPHVISAQGYEIWAESSGTCVIFPKEVLVGSAFLPNPYAERDPQNRRILAVHARAVAFRFSSVGIPQVSDWTTIFDTPSYRLIDLLAKAKKFPQAFQLLPQGMTPKEDGTWASYPFDESTSLFVNTQHEEALQWFAQILNREKKAMDFAQTFAKRNALKHLSGLQKVPGGGAEWTISVLCWRPTSGNIIKWDGTEYANLQKRIGNMIDGDGKEFDQIEYHHGKEAVSDEPGFEVHEAETDPEDQTPIDTKNEPPEAEPVLEKQNDLPVLSEEDTKLMMQFSQLEKDFPDETAQALKEMNIPGKPKPNQMKLVFKKVNQIVDQAGGE